MINKIIHQIHLSEMPNDFIKHCVSSWDIMKEFGFEIKVWNNEEVKDIILNHYPQLIEPYANCRNFGEAGDIAKYAILHHISGYYVDWDIQLIYPKTFFEIVESAPLGYLLIDPSNGTYASEFFSAQKDDILMQQLMNDIAEIYHTQTPPPFAPQYTGPYRMRETVQKIGIVAQKIIPVKEIFEYDYSEIRSATFKNVTKVAIHYWAHSWIK